MKIVEISINNFRSIKKSKFNINDVTAIVGANNSGKSSILRALNCFFNLEEEKKDFYEKKHQYTIRSSPIIEIKFTDIPNKQLYSGYLNNNEFIIRLKFYPNTNKFKYQIKNARTYVDIKPDFISGLKDDITFVLIPTSRDYKQTTTSEKTILKNLLETFLEKHTAKRDTLSPKINDSVRYFSKYALNKVARELNLYYALKHKFNFELSHEKNIDYKILLDDLSLLINEKDKKFRLNDVGSGIQSLVIIAMFRYLSELKNNNIILGIEEPEINLHPQSQIEWIKSIKSYPYKNVLQVIFTTHSSIIIDYIDHTDIILCKKYNDDSRGFKTITNKISNDFWTRYNLRLTKYYQFYRYRNSEFFYSKFVIVVESKTDAEVVKRLLLKRKIDTELLGISFLNLEGVKNFKYPFYLLKELEIPFFTILDKDFFLPYSNNSANKSRNSSGFFKYKKQYKNDSVIKSLIPSQTDRAKLLKLMFSNHSKALDLFVKHNIICFKYNLEMDLIASVVATNKFFDILGVEQKNRNRKYLLVNKKDNIKNLENLLEVIDNIPHKNLPNSYKRIKNILEKKINELF